ncbi:hypothetical protein [Cellulophaga fucicola]|uniref:Uncharacterized protein n=1 Tax=Cellulophaga fucicola TaxID=76595 RepID=A0A1K1QWS2_9FLAO|nr:hypothetical protein [Cellulophaga fucicola]SFW64221.1 hypothetical protein SAMN05660313_03040 [Cellulophaga fucicola]
MGIQADNPNLIELLREQSKKLEKDRKVVLSKINPWLDILEKSSQSKIEKKQKHKEIIDIGNFIHYFDSSLVIEDALSESPDFIIKQNELNIGVELKDLVIRQNEKEKEGILKSLFEQIKSELKSEEKSLCGFYRVELVDENLSLKKKNREALKKEIIALIKGQEIEQEYVKAIKKRPMSEISIYKGETTILGNLERTVVEEKIKSKENKLKSYTNENLDEIWLLLVIAGVEKSSDYSFFDSGITEKPFESNFDKIFIYDFSHREITELKITLPNKKLN